MEISLPENLLALLKHICSLYTGGVGSLLVALCILRAITLIPTAIQNANFRLKKNPAAIMPVISEDFRSPFSWLFVACTLFAAKVLLRHYLS